jgi:hypothetical protein
MLALPRFSKGAQQLPLALLRNVTKHLKTGLVDPLWVRRAVVLVYSQ